MYEIMKKLNSLSLFVGTGNCNARCGHCAGIPLRKYSPKKDGVINKNLIEKTVRTCYTQGARYLSISGSGEPTLSPISVTKVFDLLQKFEKEGIKFSPINLYSNGIRIGKDKLFSDEYLHLWKNKGLTNVYVTVHDIDEKKNARIYGIKKYPPLENVVSRIHGANLFMRANIILSKGTIDTFEKFFSTINYLINIGVDNISAWPIRDKNDDVDVKLSLLEIELDKMEDWIEKDNDLSQRIRLLREKRKIVYQKGQKLTLFPDGSLSSTWCK